MRTAVKKMVVESKSPPVVAGPSLVRDLLGRTQSGGSTTQPTVMVTTVKGFLLELDRITARLGHVQIELTNVRNRRAQT